MTTIPRNPFKEYRLKQGISQYEVARRIGISKHAILRLEQGCYENPLPSVIDYYLGEFPKLTRTHLLNMYQEFQYEVRKSNALLFGHSIKLLLEDCPVGTHPLTYLRTSVGINPTELAKRLCISQSTIVYFERRSIHQHSVPEQLIRSLHDADYDENDTEALKSAYEHFRNWLKSEKTLKLVRPEPEQLVEPC